MRKISTLILFILAFSLGVFAQSIETIQQNATNIVSALQLTGAEKDNFYNVYVKQAQQVKNTNNLKLPVKLKEQKVNQMVAASNNQLKNTLSTDNKTKFDLYTAQGANLYLNPTITASTSTSNTVDMSGLGTFNPFESATTTTVSTSNNTAYNSLPADQQLIVNNIKSQLQLNDNQFNSFSVDYKSFLEGVVSIQQGSGTNAQKQQALVNQILTTSNSVKQYLSTSQYAAYENLVKTNQLGKNAIPQIGNNATVTTNNNGVQSIDMSGGSNNNTVITTPSVNTNSNAAYNSLPADQQLILNNVKSQLQLNNNQFNSFSVDYKSFLEGVVKIQQSGGNTTQQQQALISQLTTTSNSVKKYLSNDQFTAFENLVKTNTLGKNATPQVSANASTYVPTTTLPAVVTPNAVDNGLNSAAIVDIVKDIVGLNVSQVTQTKAILTQYDAEVANLKSLYPNNPTKQKQESDNIGNKYVHQVQKIMSQNQLLQLAVAIDLQKKLYYGVGLTPSQMQTVNKLKAYGLTDAQVSQVALIMVEGAIKGDAVKKSGSQQEAVQLLNELDAKLKSVLTTAQYDAIKNDIMSQMK
ncbi:MAG: hypothetical protein H6553_11860 [Chitinophagales bacterium]|nr:hypothetical protein [Chitinophagales bacterium]